MFRKCIAGILLLAGCATIVPERTFLDPTDPRLPPSVTKSFHSIFQIVFIIPDKVEPIKKRNKKAKAPETVDERIWEQEEEKCRAKQQKNCRFSRMVDGSAVLVSDSATLWTAGHVVNRAMERNKGKLPPFILVDQSGAIVWDSRQKNHRAKIEYLGVNQTVQYFFPHSQPDDYSSLVDFAELKLLPALDRPAVQVAQDRTSVGYDVYIAGYPAEYFDGINASRSHSLRISRGEILAYWDVLMEPVDPRYLGEVGEKLKEEDQAFVFSTAIILSGSSGSPVFNKEGALIGLAVASHDAFSNKDFDRKEVRERSSILDAVRWIPTLKKEVPTKLYD